MSTDLAHTDDTDSLSILPPAQPMHASSVSMLMEHTKAMGAAFDLAEKMDVTQLVPSIYRGKPEDGTAAILYESGTRLDPDLVFAADFRRPRDTRDLRPHDGGVSD